MTKILTKKDVEAKKDPKRRRAMLERQSADNVEAADFDIEGTSKFAFLDNLIDAHKNSQLHFADQWKEEEQIRNTMMKIGMLSEEKNGFRPFIRDKRIPSAEEKKILEFASQLTKGNPNLIVEMADQGFSVYKKGASTWDKKNDYIVEFAEYPRRKKEIVETGDKNDR